MTGPRRARTVILRLTRLEAHHLGVLVGQFRDLLAADEREDPALARLTPAAYRDDDDAARDFRDVTAAGLLERRGDDAAVVLAALVEAADADDDDDEVPFPIELSPDEADAWMRTLAAVRLVLASRLGVDEEDTHAADDPRFGIYDWIGFRLEGLVRAATG